MVTLPDEVVTERLRLPVWTADDVAAIRGGARRPGWHPDFPREDDRDAASMWRPDDPWSSRSIVRGTTVLGSIGFFGPPAADAGSEVVPEVEVGYGLVPEARGWGFATEALLGLLAATDAAGVRVRAAVDPGNRPGLRVLATCGFTELRGSDEDGRLVMARPLPAVPG
ncbi:GNAT family N-acetyltransferase [Nocardioides sp. SYSU D00038]|uniref:GNAT family N-acetyltransferase n=1 Tax=Nocardioides sp. SYSU D00038 TaxID=2812554 RepID=UPI0027DD3F47|nr:GNAT family N-acetyltransferase [Nocardioides sp. SYSU D00038]